MNEIILMYETRNDLLERTALPRKCERCGRKFKRKQKIYWIESDRNVRYNVGYLCYRCAKKRKKEIIRERSQK